jgi:hypothetical protein
LPSYTRISVLGGSRSVIKTPFGRKPLSFHSLSQVLLTNYKRCVVKDSAVNAICYGAKLMIPGPSAPHPPRTLHVHLNCLADGAVQRRCRRSRS